MLNTESYPLKKKQNHSKSSFENDKKTVLGIFRQNILSFNVAAQ